MLPRLGFASLFVVALCASAGSAYATCTTASPCATTPTILGTLGGTVSNARGGVSDDGSAIAGISYVIGNTRHAFRWDGGAILDLGTLGGAESFATAISGNGSVVVGWSNLSDGTIRAFRWDAAGGMQDLGTLGGPTSDATAVSIDGSVVAGTADVSSGVYHAFRWEGGTMQDLGTLGGSLSIATDMSGDGSVVVGESWTTGDAARHAYRWEGGTMQDLGTLGGGQSDATAVSRDGSTVIGESQTTGNLEYHAFRWQNNVLEDLGTLGGTQSYAAAVDSDGSVVIGYSYTTGDSTYHAYRWEAGAMQDLGTLGGSISQANALNHDGSIVVGVSTNAGGSSQAFRWTAATGMQDLNVLLVAAGVDMTGINLFGAQGVSVSGEFIAGSATYAGQTRAYIVRYNDGTGGLTTVESVQQSVNDLGAARAGAMAQQHAMAMPLLGDDKPIEEGSEIGIFGQAGSGQGGGYARIANRMGFAILAGVSYGYENYDSASIDNALMGALALRYIVPGTGSFRPFVEAGGWIAPDADLEFQRTYMNGAGTAVGVGSTQGDVSYLFARAGALYALGQGGQLALSAEVGRERLDVRGYAEGTSSSNPFDASVSAGTDTTSLAKARVQWSASLGYGFDATVWGAGVYGFDRQSELEVAVAGVGMLTPIIDDDIVWAEYGARVGYALTTATTLDVFVNGVSGQEGVDTRIHGGAGLRYRF